MTEPYLPVEIWLKICLCFHPRDITNIILLVKNYQNRELLCNISFELCKKYYRNINPTIERLFLLKTNIHKVTTKKEWIDNYIDFNYKKIFIDEHYDLFVKYALMFKNSIQDKKDKDKYGNIVRI